VNPTPLPPGPLPAFPRLRRRFTQAMVNRYGRVNEDRNLIHYDAAAAERAGFPRPVVHGALVAALLSEACRDYFGRRWMEQGSLKIAFIRPVLVEQAVQTGAAIVAEHADGRARRVELDVWCQNDSGERVVAGQASCVYADG
jgi:enoyl-CoA hydratase